MAGPVLFRGWIEALGRYPTTLIVIAACDAITTFRRTTHQTHPSTPSDATWFVPVYIWGLESIGHAHWWAFRASWRGIAPNLLWIGIEQSLYSAGVLALVCLACFHLERRAYGAGLRSRVPQATLPLPVVAGILSVVEAWSILIWAMAPGFAPYHAGK